MTELNVHVVAKPSDDHQDERCTAPHPARAFLLALPAFAIATAVVLLLWKVVL